MPLPWSIIQLAQRAIAGTLSRPIQQERTRIHLRPLYFIPGAIRDVLARYAAGRHYFLEILPPLNSLQSLEIIDELRNSPNDDVALSVRCVAAVVAAFVITPPRQTLGTFIGDNDAGKQFLEKRLGVRSSMDSGVDAKSHPGDNLRLQNIKRFFADIKDLNTEWWTSENADSSLWTRLDLYEARHTEEYRTGRHTSHHHDDRASSTFLPAVQQDLITLTLEILAQDPVANAATAQREAFRDVCMPLEQEATARAQALAETLGSQELPAETWALTQVRAADSIGLIRRALEPVIQGLSVPQNTTPHADHTSQAPPQIPAQQIVTAPSTPVSPTLPGSTSPSAGPSTAVGRSYDSSV